MATALTQTTLSGSINQNALVLTVASATGITAPVNNVRQTLYVINLDQTKGEAMDVIAVSGTSISVARVTTGLYRQSFYTGAIVIIGPQPTSGPYSGGNIIGVGFQENDPVGDPSVSGSYPGAPVYTPWINTTNGNQWLQGINGQWVPGWNNPSTQKGVTAAVASAAGLVTPSGPLFHITGALAITGFTIPVGFAGGSFTVIPDGTFTWTAATNIALLGTAVVSKTITFTYDSNAGLFYPNVVA